ncbi:c-type cytochrome [Aurantibacter crassamenti]|uniref:c-type cytochrome n=1 Tax=Aurantibacter crassamenti TaxID=1837375 RepID=UPI00193944E8|nr:c-type cytochrome [Aurantibacter crassamenti]MBM1108095.1 c-type cytochrome [Aurantibacter crassamenti]
MKQTKLLFLLLIIVFSCKEDNTKTADDSAALNTVVLDSISINLPTGFELEELYSPSDHEQGSWVALAQGPDQKMFACDQYGKIYQFNAPAKGGTINAADIKALDLPIGEAHGLHWAFNSLYVAVNKRWQEGEEYGSGIYRLTDSNNDGELDKIDSLLKLDGAGEHGPHSFVTSPDGKELYFIAGNHVLVPDALKTNSRLPTNWGEDNLFTPYLDARGHANDIKAPGGWIAKFSPDGTDWELISAGFRNPFDMAFNKDGELFAYDADMEWDIGMPWYRPTRICHVTSGSEFGWRTGSGKWPAYYPDGLPAVHNLEQGSPTAVLAGNRLNFPAKYDDGILIMDWSFGTIYFIDLTPEGSSYKGEREEFLSGTPLPLTDMIAGADGNLYFATGGRRIDSHFYRLTYTGADAEKAALTENTEGKDARQLRRSIEKFHSVQSEEGVTLAWDNLNSEDRFIRYASRVALEHQPTSSWQQKFFDEKDPVKTIEAGLALAHQGNKNLESKILEKLNKINLETLTQGAQLDLLRTYQVIFIRMGEPASAIGAATGKKLNSYFPHANNAINRELGQLLLYLKADGATEGLVNLLEKHAKEKTVTEGVEMLSEEASLRSEQYGQLIRDVIAKMPPSESIYYGMLLSHADKGWTKELREKYFKWFFDVMSSKGGMSFKAYIENVRQEAMAKVPISEKEYFEEISGIYSPADDLADLPEPIGPGKAYTMPEARGIYNDNIKNYKGTVADGERAYKAALCITCHRMKGEGGATGPDLTQMHTKFSSYDLTFALVSPSEEISDQYSNSIFHTKDGKQVIGRLISEEGDSLSIMPNAYNPAYTLKLAKTDVEKQELSSVSPMPPGLLNRLNEKEITDLFAYLLSGGDKNHKIYTGEN